MWALSLGLCYKNVIIAHLIDFSNKGLFKGKMNFSVPLAGKFPLGPFLGYIIII